MKTRVRFEGEAWWLIEDFEDFFRRWQRALRRRRFFEVRYAGRRYYVNPMAIIYATNGWS